MRAVIPFALATCSSLVAQVTLGGGAVSGTVLDESGAVVPGAEITLTEQSKGLIRKSESDRDGSFLFPSVIAGLYALRAEKPDFSAGLMNNLRIDVGERISVTLTLQVGEVRTSVIVRSPTAT